MDRLCRPVHPTFERAIHRKNIRPCSPARSRTLPNRPETYGRSLQGDQRPSDRMDAMFQCSRSETRRSAGMCDRRPCASSPRPALGNRDDRIIWMVSSSGPVIKVAKRGDINPHYGSEPGSKFCCHLPISTAISAFCRSARPRARQPMSACSTTTPSWRSRSTLLIPEVRAIMYLPSSLWIGKRFAPRLRNLKDRKFHTFEKADHPALAKLYWRRQDQYRPHSGTLG